MSKWITFVEVAAPKGYTTRVWHVRSTFQPVILGEVRWYGPWRQYAFYPKPNTLYERQCLRDIADHCDTETTAHFRAARAAKAAKKVLTR